jgi:signal transduction histidine kinase
MRKNCNGTRRNAEGDVAEVRVSDSGTSIPEEDLVHIFDAFVTTKPQGTGLGLPIARTIIESYGGTTWAENRMRSAAFCFTLPLAKPQGGEGPRRVEQAASAPLTQRGSRRSADFQNWPG